MRPKTTVFGNPNDAWMEILEVDEATGELFLVYAPALADLDRMCDELLAA